jgi:uncharacterized membrane protein
METIQTTQRLRSVFNILKLTYGLVPIVAGLDKFTNLLTNWEQYLNPAITNVLPFSLHTFMMIVGVIEIVAGLILLSKPAIGGYIVMAWLALIALSLLASKNHLDVAVRDVVMSIGAFSFVQITKIVLGSETQHVHSKTAFT